MVFKGGQFVPATTTTEDKTDTTRYARSKGPRGNWVYTPSPRGMTKAQYEELDKKKKE